MVGRLSLQPIAGERFEAATRRSHESLLDSPDSGLPPSPSHPLYPAAGPPRAADGGPAAPGARGSPLYAPGLLQHQQRLENLDGHQDLRDEHRGEPASPPRSRILPPPSLCASHLDGFGDLTMTDAAPLVVVVAPPRRLGSGFMGSGSSPPLWGAPRQGVCEASRVAEEPGVGGGCVTRESEPRLGRLLPYVTLCGGLGGPGGSGGPRLVPSDYSESVCVQAGPRTTSTRCCSEVHFACGRRYREVVDCEPALAVASCRQTVVARPSTTRRSFTSELRLEPRQRARLHTATAFAFPRHARRLFRTTVTSGGAGGVVVAAPSGGAAPSPPATARGSGTRYTSCVRLRSLAPPGVGIVYREDGRAGT